MSSPTTFEQKWLQGVSFDVGQPQPFADLCPPAQEMVAVCEAMIDPLRKTPDEVLINVALLQLQHQYHQRYALAPKAHRDHIGTRNGHTCLFQVYRYYYSQLCDLLLKVNPPPLRPSAQAPTSTVSQPQEPRFEGIYLGEDLGTASVP